MFEMRVEFTQDCAENFADEFPSLRQTERFDGYITMNLFPTLFAGFLITGNSCFLGYRNNQARHVSMSMKF